MSRAPAPGASGIDAPSAGAAIGSGAPARGPAPSDAGAQTFAAALRDAERSAAGTDDAQASLDTRAAESEEAATGTLTEPAQGSDIQAAPTGFAPLSFASVPGSGADDNAPERQSPEAESLRAANALGPQPQRGDLAAEEAPVPEGEAPSPRGAASPRNGDAPPAVARGAVLAAPAAPDTDVPAQAPAQTAAQAAESDAAASATSRAIELARAAPERARIEPPGSGPQARTDGARADGERTDAVASGQAAPATTERTSDRAGERRDPRDGRDSRRDFTEQAPPARFELATDGAPRADGRSAFRLQDFGSETGPRAAQPPATAVAGTPAAPAAIDAAGAARDPSGASASTPQRILPESLPAGNDARVLEQARILLDQSGGRARISLSPPELGRLGITVRVTDSQVQLELAADRLPVAELLARHLPELQQALASHGLQIDRATVELRDRGIGDDSNGSRAFEHGGSGLRRESADDPSGAGTRRSRPGRPGWLGALDVVA